QCDAAFRACARRKRVEESASRRSALAQRTQRRVRQGNVPARGRGAGLRLCRACRGHGLIRRWTRAPPMPPIALNELFTLILAILAILPGIAMNARSATLRASNIPPAVL